MRVRLVGEGPPDPGLAAGVVGLAGLQPAHGRADLVQERLGQRPPVRQQDRRGNTRVAAVEELRVDDPIRLATQVALAPRAGDDEERADPQTSVLYVAADPVMWIRSIPGWAARYSPACTVSCTKRTRPRDTNGARMRAIAGRAYPSTGFILTATTQPSP